MPHIKALDNPVDVVYTYDGGLDGFLCCVYESVYRAELPFDILPLHEAQPSLMETRHIETDFGKAVRVYTSLETKICARAQELVETVFLSCMKQREMAMLRFLLLGYKEGRRVADMLGHPDVAPLLSAEKHLLGEAHLLKGFVRFTDYDGQLAATITPKNFVLPFLLSHFVGRYSEEEFMIYDKTHGAALIYQQRKARIIPAEDLEFGPASETEELYRALWKQFYETIAIRERYNPKCRMTHLPKRYWENMTEMRDLL